ncbi:type II toxin-antitoxin system death-on-curing family toxin [Candidatus Gracilibacteria bacterium]|nr:type II toxin-antitoxin system death-on-curing family toxin [Candidatus Gracilibacteria bacterium]
MKKELKELAIYQTKEGAIRLKEDVKNETVWASLDQIANILGRDKSVISRHIKNIFKENELIQKSVVAFFATTASDGKTYQVEYFNLDVIISVGYRVNSKIATKFRKWATKILKKHVTKGFTINKYQLKNNYQEFLQAVDNVKLLAKNNSKVQTENILELIKTFSSTWFSLESYDKQKFPKNGNTQSIIDIEAKDLYADIKLLKKELLIKKEATELFAQEKERGLLKGILGNVFQSVFGKDAYLTIEEKSAHLLYFIIKNHPFNDGNKRTGAFAFIWFLQKSGFEFQKKISPETLTTLALLIAESDPKEKEKIVGLVLLILR